ncbi:serine/threonine-protein kinase [Sulfurimonas sp.]|uniref:serine/threonine-protein kinase n=1 Tax=Sulfurimonas sp. TaxID=2022749 RepID=UPI002B480CC5|nr:serine/threonine-protein kinase [Sulfurimonas sp.]
MSTFKSKYKLILSGNAMLNKRYTLDKKIGEGGLSEVYDVSDIYSQYFQDTRNLVIKIPSSEIANKKDVAAFVYSEYSLLNSLHHENIVKAVDFGIDEESSIPYLIMQKLEGDLLVNIALHEIDIKMKHNLASSLYKAILYMHNKGIVHADINPTNIMMSADGNAQLFDFGISQNVGTKKTFSLAIEKNNAYNPIYTAPEIFEGEAASYKTDLFSLACVLYELYTGELPFKNSSRELATKPLGRKNLEKIPLIQRAWFKKMLSHNPNLRPEKIPLYTRFIVYINNCI